MCSVSKHRERFGLNKIRIVIAMSLINVGTLLRGIAMTGKKTSIHVVQNISIQQKVA